MSFSHRAGVGSHPERRATNLQLRPAPREPQPTRLLRATPLMRRYDITCLVPGGQVQAFERIAPAMPAFEAAFSAFARGTIIATPDGPVAIEDVEPGMPVSTADGARDRISWIGAMTLYPPKSAPAPESAGLTRLTADALGMGRPMPDLILGPGARILHRDMRLREIVGSDRAFAPARALADGAGIVALTPLTPVTIYHVMCEGGHRTLRANGVEVESFHPGGGLDSVMEPELLTLFLALFPQIDRQRGFGLMSVPRLSREEIEDLLS